MDATSLERNASLTNPLIFFYENTRQLVNNAFVSNKVTRLSINTKLCLHGWILLCVCVCACMFSDNFVIFNKVM